MLVSVCTPTHNAKYLQQCWETLKAQTYQNFEWVVTPNGPYKDIREITNLLESFRDDRIKIHPCIKEENTPPTIGELKLLTFNKASGEVFVELDHDDKLAITALEMIATQTKKTPCAFIYSDSHTCGLDGTPNMFDRAWGWNWYVAEVPGHGQLPINATHPITARSLCEILYAPDHIRAWTREAYVKSGGHNPTMEVADDHELMIRTYLSGVEFVKIETPLYIHYWDSHSTSKQKVELIQKISHELRDQYLAPLVAEWCRREGLLMIDLGGAHNCPPMYTPVDLNPEVKKLPNGICADIRTIDLADVGCFRAVDFLEHIPSPEIPSLFNRLYDMLIPGGFILSTTPSITDDAGRVGRGAFQDPTHVSFWSKNNWWYYTDRNLAKYIPEYRGRFQTVRLLHNYPSEWHFRNGIPYVIADVTKLDESVYQPGPKTI